MKDLYAPENIVGEFLHSCKNFRGVCKSIKTDFFWLENYLNLNYSRKGVWVRVQETWSKLQNWHTCRNFQGTLPCNLCRCAVFLTYVIIATPLILLQCVNKKRCKSISMSNIANLSFYRKCMRKLQGWFANIEKCKIFILYLIPTLFIHTKEQDEGGPIIKICGKNPTLGKITGECSPEIFASVPILQSGYCFFYPNYYSFVWIMKIWIVFKFKTVIFNAFANSPKIFATVQKFANDIFRDI